MNRLVKFSIVLISVIAFASCGKTEYSNVVPDCDKSEKAEALRLGHDGDFGEDFDGEGFTEKDKCKKCHTGTRGMGIDWEAPFMSDNRYASIEELINNFDFVNEVHLNANSSKPNSTITLEQKQALLNYLQGIASETNEER